MAQILLSTKPACRALFLTTSPLRFDATPEAFLGQANQRPPAGDNLLFSLSMAAFSLALDVQKKTMTSKSAVPRRLRTTFTPSGSEPSVLAKPSGAPSNAKEQLALMPSLRTSGVPE